MKKLFKAIIALVIIAAIAVGVYFIFFHNQTKNEQIYTKVIALNEQQSYMKVNATLQDMEEDILNNPGYDIDNIKEYFAVFDSVRESYDVIYKEILTYGLFVNDVNTSTNFKDMNKAYDSLLKIYNNAKRYLEKTYWVNPSKDYIVNFNNVFKDALKQLNAFYFNAGMAYLTATNNTLQTNNLYKAEAEYYLFLVNEYTNAYLSETENYADILVTIKEQEKDVTANNLDKYIEEKDLIDEFYTTNINRQLFVKKCIEGTSNDYLQNIKNLKEKSNLIFYQAIVIGE